MSKEQEPTRVEYIGEHIDVEHFDKPAPATAEEHELKCLPEFFQAIVDGRKTFEIRKNDRDFKPLDQLCLCEWSEQTGYTGRKHHVLVIYVTDYEQKKGYVVMTIKPTYFNPSPATAGEWTESPTNITYSDGRLYSDLKRGHEVIACGPENTIKAVRIAHNAAIAYYKDALERAQWVLNDRYTQLRAKLAYERDAGRREAWAAGDRAIQQEYVDENQQLRAQLDAERDKLECVETMQRGYMASEKELREQLDAEREKTLKWTGIAAKYAEQLATADAVVEALEDIEDDPHTGLIAREMAHVALAKIKEGK